MENTSIELEMGVILCKYCGTEIGTFDARRVTTYYSDCQEHECLMNRASKGAEEDQD